MREDIKVSIIIPCFHGEAFVADIIGDVQSQTYGNWELIVVGNGTCQEKQREIIQKFAEIDNRIYYYSLDLPGVGRARNFGISKATGDWLAFVDVDDKLHADWLKGCVRHADPDIDMIVGGISFREVRMSKVVRSDIKLPSDEIKSSDATVFLPLYLSNLSAAYSPCSKLYRVAFLHESNVNFDETFSMCEDGIFGLELALKCKTMCLIPHVGYEYCQRNNSSAIRRYHGSFKEAAERRRYLMGAVLKKSALDERIVKKYNASLYVSDSLDVFLNEFREGSSSGIMKKVAIVKKLFEDPRLHNSWKLARPTFSNPPLVVYYIFHVLNAPFLCVITFAALWGLKRLLRR